MKTLSDFDIRLIAQGLLKPTPEAIRALALELLKWRGVKPL
jgi:hypothetical protein